MGLKQWLAKKTGKTPDLAQAHASGLVELIEHLAASLVVFSGKRAVVSRVKPGKTAFESHFEMEQAGFDPGEKKDIARLLAPNIEDLKKDIDPELACRAFRITTAFLCLYSQNAAHKYMKPKNAALFSEALFRFVSESSAGRFGFSSNPLQVANTIKEFFTAFGHVRLLNQQSFGDGDCLGVLLNYLSLSHNGSIEYGFVVGSKKQKLGCATAIIEVALRIDDSSKRAATDLQW